MSAVSRIVIGISNTLLLNYRGWLSLHPLPTVPLIRSHRFVTLFDDKSAEGLKSQ